MKAVCWFGRHDMRVETVDDPKILNPRDCIIKVTRTAICGSDLHLYNGYIPTMEQGDIVGHEFMGEVMEVGREVKKLKVGDRVVVPFTIACGNCFFCKQQLWSNCDNTNPNAYLAEALMGQSPSGLFGYSHMTGGYAGGQAQYVRVPFADVGPLKIENGFTDEQVLFLSDVFPTGYMAAENCDIKPGRGQSVAVWGCGPVGLFAIKSAFLLGAEQVIAIDRFPERLHLAEEAGAEALNYSEIPDLIEVLKELTGGRGPDACIEAVGMEGHGASIDAIVDEVKQAMKVETGRPIALRQAIQACRKGGVVSVPGVYGGFVDTIPMGAFMNKALTMRTGQTHMMKYMKPLLDHIEKGDIDPSFIISHRVGIEEVPEMYDVWLKKQDHVTKIVIDPWADRKAA
ncbi:MAG TPA: zinc-dependent alcohol dehydrogenase [Candidatus Koribacter sp.]